MTSSGLCVGCWSIDITTSPSCIPHLSAILPGTGFRETQGSFSIIPADSASSRVL
jgi:hypothetical protein